MQYVFYNQLKAYCQILFLCLISSSAYTQSPQVTIDSKSNEDNSVDFTYKKEYPGTLTIVVKFDRIANSRYSPFPKVLRSNSGRLFSLRPINKEQGIGYSFSYSFVRGAFGSKIDKNFGYVLPFKAESKVSVQELGNLGKNFFKKDLPRDWKGYQFESVEEDTVFAARKGVVVEVVDMHNIDTKSQYTANRNSILIEHEDGTLAHYSGFAKGGTLVKPGMRVYPHSPIGTLKNKQARGKLYFYVYFMAKPNEYERAKDSDLIAVHQFITPFFATESGSVQLTPMKKYKVIRDEILITSEMSKREKKKFKSGTLN